MRHSLHSHISFLQDKIQSLRERLTNSHPSAEEIQEIKAQIFHAESALEHYRRAYALEIGVSSPDPSDSTGMNSACGGGAPETSKSQEKKRGRSAIAARAKKKVRMRSLPGQFAARGDRASLRVR